MYNIFYIYTYKYTKPSNTLTLSRLRSLNTHTSQECIKQPDKPHKQEQAASHAYRAKCTSRIMHQAIQLGKLHICGDFEKLHNAFCVLVLSLFCNHIENIL